MNFTDKSGNTVSRSDILSKCSAPYKVTLSNTGGYLQTQYGLPNTNYFSGSTVTYYINPYGSGASVCSTRPNLIRGTSNFAGPANIWSPTKGFLTQSTNFSSYDRNFPTTGADGLYFDLDIGGIDASQLTWSPVTRGGITATVSWTRPRSGTFIGLLGDAILADEWISDKSSYVTRVTLHGPRASSSQIQSANPSRLTIPSLPQTFELVGRDSRGNEVKYGFVLKQWFVTRGNKQDIQSKQISWCRSLGYRLSRVRDLSNAKCGEDSLFPCSGGIDGATPSSGSGWNYQRRIGAGFFTEWGPLGNYADVDFINFTYWTSDVAGGKGFSVDSEDGCVDSISVDSDMYSSYYAVCTTP
ncbi:hypothetical protein A9G24_05895 [Gilliamella sp. App6-5]|nr:hypothetical protein A9G24_05895 [Gilliamella apicola]